jgi:hypothetical protein
MIRIILMTLCATAFGLTWLNVQTNDSPLPTAPLIDLGPKKVKTIAIHRQSPLPFTAFLPAPTPFSWGQFNQFTPPSAAATAGTTAR